MKKVMRVGYFLGVAAVLSVWSLAVSDTFWEGERGMWFAFEFFLNVFFLYLVYVFSQENRNVY